MGKRQRLSYDVNAIFYHNNQKKSNILLNFYTTFIQILVVLSTTAHYAISYLRPELAFSRMFKNFPLVISRAKEKIDTINKQFNKKPLVIILW